MSNKKYEINATDEQLTKLKQAFHVGSPLTIALSFAGISPSTYYYWVEIASIVAYSKDMELISTEEEKAQAGVDLGTIKDNVLEIKQENSHYKSSISYFKEPTAESILKYRNNRTFHEFADKVYDLITECDKNKSEIVMYHLAAIRDAAKQRGANANSSQWFLERTLPQFFGRKDRMDESETEKAKSVRIEFVDAQTKDNQARVDAMEKQIMEQYGIDEHKA